MESKYRVTPLDVESSIANEEYVRLGTKMTACVLTLKNGHEVVGISGVVDPKSYNTALGNKFAREKAIDQLWGLLGFMKQEQMSIDKRLEEVFHSLGNFEPVNITKSTKVAAFKPMNHSIEVEDYSVKGYEVAPV